MLDKRLSELAFLQPYYARVPEGIPKHSSLTWSTTQLSSVSHSLPPKLPRGDAGDAKDLELWKLGAERIIRSE